jgi:hypothetical protein
MSSSDDLRVCYREYDGYFLTVINRKECVSGDGLKQITALMTTTLALSQVTERSK